jgi:hypothetical protein
MNEKFRVCRADDSEQVFSLFEDALGYAAERAENKQSVSTVWYGDDPDNQEIALIFDKPEDSAIAIIFVVSECHEIATH